MTAEWPLDCGACGCNLGCVARGAEKECPHCGLVWVWGWDSDFAPTGLSLDRLWCGIRDALEVADRYGGIDGAQHKQWVIDQMVRLLAGARYEQWVRQHNTGPTGPEDYCWEEGCAP
jgi:hypothetical protein